MAVVEVESDIAVIEKTVMAPPRLWNVILYNDNQTSMEIVIYILMNIFHHDYDRSNDIMLHIHNNGSGIAGTYSFEVATTKRNDAVAIARQNGYPLKIEVEAND